MIEDKLFSDFQIPVNPIDITIKGGINMINDVENKRDEKLENSDNPTGNEPQDNSAGDTLNDYETPLFLSNNPETPQGNDQDLKDESPE